MMDFIEDGPSLKQATVDASFRYSEAPLLLIHICICSGGMHSTYFKLYQYSRRVCYGVHPGPARCVFYLAVNALMNNNKSV